MSPIRVRFSPRFLSGAGFLRIAISAKAASAERAVALREILPLEQFWAKAHQDWHYFLKLYMEKT
jgi:hypothetical protein